MGWSESPYATEEEFIYAVADVLRVEYEAILDAGLILQVDDAFLPWTYDLMVPPATMEEYRAWAQLRVDALNHALRGLPEERIRYHICWGSFNTPHVGDVPAKDIIDLVLQVNAGSYLIEMANPRHEHEWRIWEDVKLPEGKVLIPGVITHQTNVVEHPELVAERLTRLAKLVGRENVQGGTDCGFSQGPFPTACTSRSSGRSCGRCRRARRSRRASSGTPACPPDVRIRPRRGGGPGVASGP